MKRTLQSGCSIIFFAVLLFISAPPADAKALHFKIRETIPLAENTLMVDVKDLDNDKLEDIVLTSTVLDKWILILEKRGDSFKKSFTIEDDANIRRAVVDDVDKDGIPEILSANEKGEVKIWESVADDTYVQTHTQNIGNLIERVTTGDADGDGLREFLIPREAVPSHFYTLEGVADNKYNLENDYLGRGGNCEIMGTSDLDRDGKPELVFADDDYNRTGGKIFVYENGQSVFEDDKFAFNGRLTNKLSIGDTDANGLGEIIGLDKLTWNLRILESTGKDNTFTVIYNAPSEYEPFVIDVDNDRQSEFFRLFKNDEGKLNILSFGSRTENRIVEIYNSGELFQNFEGDINPHTIKMIGDLNGDGRLELALQQGTQIHILELSLNNSPEVSAGPNQKISSEALNQKIIAGNVTDLDGDKLKYQWKEGTRVLKTWSPVKADDQATLELGNIDPPLKPGRHTLTLEARDAEITVLDEMILTIDNSPVFVAASGAGVYRVGEDIVLNGFASDFEGDQLIYRWLEGGATIFQNEVKTVPGGKPVEVPDHVLKGGLPIGKHILTLEVEDPRHQIGVTSADIEINVIDTQAQTLHPVASPSILWPPDNKMVNVTIDLHLEKGQRNQTIKADLTCAKNPAIDANDQVIQDFAEPEIDPNKGLVKLRLRSDHPTDKEGRSYTINIVVINDAGNSSKAKLNVVAPYNPAP